MTTAQLPPSDDDLLALLLADEHGPAPVIVAGAGQAPQPLSFAQQRLWFLQQFAPQSSAYNLPRALQLDGPLHVERLQQALQQVIARHDILRTRFIEVDGQPQQVVDPSARLSLQQQDLRHLDQAARDTQLNTLMVTEAGTPFDLSQAPLIRATLIALPAQRHVLLLNMHHIVSDAWSNPILMHDLARAYQGQPLQRPAIQYADYARWQREDYPHSPGHDAAAAYWRTYLGDALAPLQLPTEHPRNDDRPTVAATHRMPLPRAQVERLNAFCQRHGLTPFGVLLGAWQLLLGRYAGQDDFTVGVPNASRNQAQTQALVGYFVSSQIFRAHLDPSQTTLDFLHGVRRHALATLEHADHPVELMLEQLQLQRSTQANPLFQSLFNWRVASDDSGPLRFADLALDFLPLGQQQAKFDLSLDVLYSPGSIEACFDYDATLFGAERIAALAGHFGNLLDALLANPQQALGELSMYPQHALSACLAAAQGAAQPYSTLPAVHLQIAAQAALTPERIAVRCAAATLTYAELEHRANRLAQRLIEHGVGPDVLVGVALARSLALVVGLLAIHKAGGAYLPLDPSYPPERLDYMIRDSGITLLLRQPEQAQALPLPDGVEALAITELDDVARTATTQHTEPAQAHPLQTPTGRSAFPDSALNAEARATSAQAIASDQTHPLSASASTQPLAMAHLDNPHHTAPARTPDPEHLAYVIYTSGSTGQPKGVQVRHAGLINHMAWMQRTLQLQPSDRVLQKTAFSFDASVWEFWLALQQGAELVLASPALSEDLSRLWDEVHAHGISVLQMAPSLLQALLPQADAAQLNGLRLWLLGGEALGAELVTQVQARFAGRLVNLYGPTEATIDSCYHDLQGPLDGAVAPIGHPIDNAQGYVLDDQLQPCPQGTPGELYLGGAGLARGYHQRPALTAERFVPHPFGASGQRLYRSGDLTRRRADGALDYLSRLDHQVKVRGLRIELGEIESQLLRQPGVSEAAVLAQPGAHGLQLVAYTAPAATHSAQALREALLKTLPDYMLPAHFLLLDALPLTANGKLDRRALPTLDQHGSQRGYVAPRSPLEQRIAAIWQSTLNRPQISLDDNFFELGGDSILSIQVVSRARQAGIHFTPKDLFTQQTIQALAQVASLADDAQVLDQGPVTGPAPLLPIQQAFFDMPLPERGQWNQSVMLKPATALNPELLSQALAALIDHHDALRLRFAQGDAGWVAEHAELRSDDSLLWQADVADTQAQTVLANQAQRSLDLAHGPLLRAVLMTLADGSQRLLLVIHHLVVDGVSWRILFDDLQQVYGQLQAGQAPQPMAKTSAFKAWGERLRQYAQRPQAAAELAYWQAQAHGLDPDLPGANPGASLLARDAHTVGVQLSQEHTRQLLHVAPAAYRTRINDLLLSALARAVQRWSGLPEVLVQLEGHGREALFDELDLTRTVGWFTSLFPVRLSPQADVPASIKTIKEQLRAVPDNGLGYGALRYLGSAEVQASLRALPSPRITFNYLGQFDASFGNDDAPLFAPCADPVGDEKHAEAPLGNWLTVNSQVFDGRLNMAWTFSQQMFEPAHIEALAQHCQAALIEVIEHCAQGEHFGVTPSDFPLAPLSQAQLDALPIPARNIDDIFPLSPMQEGLLVHTLLEQHSGIYFMQECYTIREPLDYALFDAAWQQVVQRYEAVRASFLWNTGGELLQVIHRDTPVQVTLLDLSDLPLEQAEARIVTLLREEREAGFDLSREPPIRFQLIKLADHSHRFVMSNHHILIDAWCRSLLMADFFELYHAAREQRPSQLRTPYRFRQFIEWLQAQDPQAAEHFWRTQLNGVEQATALPTDRPQVGGAAHSRIDDNYTWLSTAQSAQLLEAANRHRLTVNTFVQAAWALTLHQHSRSHDIVFGVTVSGRPAHIPEMQDTVGLFINSVPLRIQLPTPDRTVTTLDWLHGILDSNVSLREYDYLPLVRIQACSDLPKGQPLFDSLFVFENAPLDASVGNDARDMGVVSESSRTHTNYPITVVVYPGEQLGLHLSYDTRYFERSTMDALLAQFQAYLVSLPPHLQQPLHSLTQHTPDDPRAWSLQHNQTEAAHALDRSFVELFEAQVDRCGEAIAAACGEVQWRYRDLDQQANRVGQALLAAGVHQDQPVALLAERSLELLASIVGAFKAGAGYLPLDPSHPDERLIDILARSQTPALLCTASQRARAEQVLAGVGHRVRLLVWEHLPLEAEHAQRPGVYSAPNSLAYVIFTSGSTGQPKGVLVEQAGMLNNQLSKLPYLQLDARDIIAQTASQSFDISVWQFLTALLCGAQVRIFPDAVSRHPTELLRQVRERRVSVLEIVPALIQALLDQQHAALPDLRWLLPTGEALPAEIAAGWLRRYPAIPLVNAYGPAECSDDVAFYRIDSAATARSSIPIGYPTDNNRLYLLDDYLDPVPDGAVGELCVAGVGVGRGYCADPAKTVAVFVPNPFALQPGERLYKTGDLARRRKDDGALEYLGRVDQQVKVNGYRIELGEIEAQISQFDGVREAAVIVAEHALGKRLVAFMTVADVHATGPAALQALRDFLKTRLPAYMTPALYQVLEQMPRNANGKLDRKALARLDVGGPEQCFRAPQSALQQAVAAIWQTVLKTERVGLDDNFFALGGNSLLATQVTSRIQLELAIEAPLALLFESASLDDFTRRLPAAAAPTPETELSDLFDLLDELETH
ncbi:amino acid adenylation domain-containing protein [Pseudomonas sp. RP23018S]|uniref:non-ribosomal peptide synthetase n=1 Tax=Pseudomonas sp. RP23018S TaxID=3096037 RepID=UPI002ACA27A4|nr:non-ribosomal peptide synthetase [Pseudomonas sp. RP23018S]MDZ5604327.1 amino acid adenylation domain-containing protein [Pseudomonas sp. RP23018S]